jgi:hypothetical protein
MERRGKNNRAQVGTMEDCTCSNEEEYKRHETAILAHHKGRDPEGQILTVMGKKINAMERRYQCTIKDENLRDDYLL